MEYCFYQGSTPLFYSLDFETINSLVIIDSLFSIASLCILLVLLNVIAIGFNLIFQYMLFTSAYLLSNVEFISYFSFTQYIPLHSTTTFTIAIFQEFFLIFSSYILKGPINLIEVFTGLNSIFQIHYFSYYQLVILFSLLFLILTAAFFTRFII